MSNIVLNEKITDEFFKFYFQIPEYNINIIRTLMLNFKPFMINSKYINKFIDMLPEEIKNNKQYTNNIIARFKSENPFWKLHNNDDIKSRILDSKYRILLIDNTDKNSYSNCKIINIEQNDNIFPYKETVQHSQERNSVQDYIKHLLKNSKLVSVKDKYAFNRCEEINSFFYHSCNCNVEIYTSHQSRYNISNQYSDRIKPFQYSEKNMHDRYIEITYNDDSKITILLSSGLEYLFNTKKELTIVVY